MKVKFKQIAHYTLTLGYIICAVALLILAAFGLYELARWVISLEIVRHYYWLPISAAYTVGSIVWTWKAEQRLRALKEESRIATIIADRMSAKLADVENFLENGATLRQIKTPAVAPSVVFPLVVPRVNVPESKEGA